MPLYTVYILSHKTWPFGEILCDLWLSLDYTACLCSIYTVFCITFHPHRLPLLHLHRLLYYCRPFLLYTHAGAVPGVAHQAQDMYSNWTSFYTLNFSTLRIGTTHYPCSPAVTAGIKSVVREHGSSTRMSEMSVLTAREHGW